MKNTGVYLADRKYAGNNALNKNNVYLETYHTRSDFASKTSINEE